MRTTKPLSMEQRMALRAWLASKPDLGPLTPMPPQAWQCSACKRVFFGRVRDMCPPPCGVRGYWSGSVDPVALAEADALRPRTRQERAYDVVLAALAEEADRG